MKKLIYAYGVYWLCVKTHECLVDGTFTRILSMIQEKIEEISNEPEIQKEVKKLKEEPGSIKRVKNKIGF